MYRRVICFRAALLLSSFPLARFYAACPFSPSAFASPHSDERAVWGRGGGMLTGKGKEKEEAKQLPSRRSERFEMEKLTHSRGLDFEHVEISQLKIRKQKAPLNFHFS